jgi:hypothetical protein
LTLPLAALAERLREFVTGVAEGWTRFHLGVQQRGHQVYRVIEVDAVAGRPRAIIWEEPKTFFDYRTANGYPC